MGITSVPAVPRLPAVKTWDHFAPFLLISNHTSSLDPLLLALAVRCPVCFLCHQGIGNGLLKRLWIRSLGGFFIRPGDVRRGAIATALRRLRQGRSVCLFPEGTRSRDGRLLPLQTGASYIALASGVPVLPAVVIGAHRVMSVGATWPGGGQVTVRLGPVIATRSREVSRASIRDLTERFAEALADLLPSDQLPIDTRTHPQPARSTHHLPQQVVLR